MVIIIGAGISGLTLAHTLQQQGQDYVLLEAANQVGGYISTETNGHYQLEWGPNSYLFDAETIRWVTEDLELGSQILMANDVSKHRFIWRKGQYRALPQSPISLLFGGFFSWGTKVKILAELFRKPSTTPAETTIADFFGDRFGQEVLDYAVGPFVSGIYAGDVQNLLVGQTFGSVVRMADQEGSLIKAFAKSQKGVGRRQSLTFRDGMEVLPQAIAAHLNHLHLGHRVRQLKRQTQHWEVLVENANGVTEVLEGSQVVLCMPAFAVADLVKDILPKLAEAASKVIYPAMVAVHTAWRKQDIAQMPTGFGGLHPQPEGRFALGNIWTSQVFDGRCPADQALFTAFVGGTTAPEKAQLPDDEILKQVIKEQQEAYKIKTEPTFKHIIRWKQAIPQYDIHQLRAEQAYNDRDKNLGLSIMANWMGGISLSDCIRKGREGLPPNLPK